MRTSLYLALFSTSMTLACGDSDASTTSDPSSTGLGTDNPDSVGPTTATESDATATDSAATVTDTIGDTSSSDTADSSSSDTSTGGDAMGVVPLGAAVTFTILAKTGISNVPPTSIDGDIGVSPAAASYLTGFSLVNDATEAFSTSTQVNGLVYAADYAPPTPAQMTAAVLDMELAFTDAAGRAADVTELGAGDIGGMTLEPGVYRWGTGLLVPTDLTLEGSATDVWIFQIAEDLTVSNGTDVVLAGGALPEHVFWQVGGLFDLGTTAHLAGTVMTQTSARLGTGASVDGRLFAQTAVVLDGNTVVGP
ncbi:MAG: DUF3494 domain-containing protein [Myxococcales bacterium]|nr:DUF3494 domain-containing protein [Myxococcales bacterium]